MRQPNTSSAIKAAVKNIAAPFRQAFTRKNKTRRLTCHSDTALDNGWVLMPTDDIDSTSNAGLFAVGASNTITTTFSDNVTTLNNTSAIHSITRSGFIVAVDTNRDGSETYIYAANTSDTVRIPTSALPIPNSISTMTAQFSASMPNLEQVSTYHRSFPLLAMSLEELTEICKHAFLRRKIPVYEQSSDSVLHFDAGHPSFNHDLVQMPMPQFWPGCNNSARFLKLPQRRRWKRRTSVPDAADAHGAAEC